MNALFGYGSSELHRQGEMTAESLIRVRAATSIHRSMSDESTDWTTPAIGSTLMPQFATRLVSVSVFAPGLDRDRFWKRPAHALAGAS
jgi:hypothetical protein